MTLPLNPNVTTDLGSKLAEKAGHAEILTGVALTTVKNGKVTVQIGSDTITVPAASDIQRNSLVWIIAHPPHEVFALSQYKPTPLIYTAAVTGLALTTTFQTIASHTFHLAMGKLYKTTLSLRALDVSSSPGTVILQLNGTGMAGLNDHYIDTLASGTYGAGTTFTWVHPGVGADATLVVQARTLTGTGNVHAQPGPATFFLTEEIGIA